MKFNKIFLVLIFFLMILPLFARDVEITVEDADLGLPLEGAVVRSWDGTQYICDRDGKAVISAPDERQVLIYASYPGYENGRLVITAGNNTYTLGLQLSGIRENKELVIEASRPGSGGAETGRSITITERDIAQTGEIGIIEDVMSSIKLLPGVGYAGFFNAMPSIRGGDPGDMSAALDGYYVFNPYHWGGGYSIFDPRMVQSAKLSHGVFSTRYGNTISGLLEITTKKPSSTETEFELGVNTSAANFSLSLPLSGSGGLLFMGRVTYYDPIVWLIKQLSHSIEALEPVNAIRVAPFIRSTTITGNYRFSDSLELQGTGFFGMDGVGVTYDSDSSEQDGLNSSTRMEFDWTNYQGFIKAGLLWNPRSDMLVKFTLGTGFEDALIKGDMEFNIRKRYFSSKFQDYYNELKPLNDLLSRPVIKEPYPFDTKMHIDDSIFMFNAQGRVDYDWELGKGFLFAAGIQELFTRFAASGKESMLTDIRFDKLNKDDQDAIQSDFPIPLPPNLYISMPIEYSPDTGNKMFTTSGYSLVEYSTDDKRFNAELGLRVDHFYLIGKNFSIQSKPALNPRLNVDYKLLEDYKIINSLSLSAGTGLFSSINDFSVLAEEHFKISEIKPNRSWTSIFGIKTEFPLGLIFNIEFYYKYIFDRMYIPMNVTLDTLDIQPKNDGKGRSWGIDIFLQKLQSRYWDGWISYSFNWVNYYDPDSGNFDFGSGRDRKNEWYFPSYHRYHNLNLVLNFRPSPRINIYTRFGFASGRQIPRRIGDEPQSYPVYVYDPDNVAAYTFIEKFFWPTEYDKNHRTTPSFPMDIKFSFFGKNEKGKAHWEVYFAVENVLALVYTAQGNTRFNQYTGEVDTGSDSANYEIPVPIPSFGFKISY